MIYIAIFALLIGALGGGGGVWWVYDAKVAKAELAQAKADAALAAAQAKARQEVENKLIDMDVAYQQGKAESRTVYRTITKQGSADVAKYPVFSNPQCVLPDDSLHNLNSARSGELRPASDTSGVSIGGSLPEVPTAAGRQDSNPVSAGASGRGDIQRVSPQPSAASGGGEVQGRVLQPAHPKPRPIGRD